MGRGQASISFLNHSTAGSATIFSSTFLNHVFFSDASTAGNALIDFGEGIRHSITFDGHSTAGSATLRAGDGGSVRFFDHSSAGDVAIQTSFSLGTIAFNDSSTAGRANIQAFGAQMFFSDSSKGGTAAIRLLQGVQDIPSSLDISSHSAPGVTIGSLAGDETAIVFLGANNLTVGSNNLSATFPFFGVIQDGGVGGSLTKIGSGTLILAGANTYTGNTNVKRGVLQVDGSITSNTFVNHGGTLAGTGTINGNVMNSGKVSAGDSPGVLTVAQNYTQAQYAALMIQIAGMSTGEFSVLNVLGNANLNGFLDPVLLGGFVPTIGDSFVFLNYGSLTGEFSGIRNRVFDNGMLQWSVIYEANHAILTVAPNVPDQGSTFLLLTLGLLGLVTYRRQLLRGQP
jgi:autotransporter-associated beta strand protein